MNRRQFLAGILAAGVAPVIIRADALMKVQPLEVIDSSGRRLVDAGIYQSGFKNGDSVLIRDVPMITVVAYKDAHDLVAYDEARHHYALRRVTWDRDLERKFASDHRFRLCIASMPNVRRQGMKTWR